MVGRVADNKASMTSLKTKIRSEMTILTANLQRNVSWRLLERNLERVWKEWEDVEKLYQNILTLTDNVEDEAERNAHLAFQTELFTLRDQVQDAVTAGRDTEETRNDLARKEGRIRTFGEKWTAAYHRIDTVLGELKLALEVTPSPVWSCSGTRALDWRILGNNSMRLMPSSTLCSRWSRSRIR